MEIHIHGNAQDQIGQIMKERKARHSWRRGPVFHVRGKRRGQVYVLGNAAGRPLINAAGHPRVVINGTALGFSG